MHAMVNSCTNWIGVDNEKIQPFRQKPSSGILISDYFSINQQCFGFQSSERFGRKSTHSDGGKWEEDSSGKSSGRSN